MGIVKYQAELKIRVGTSITEEQALRRVALAIVNDLPIEKLKKLFNLEATYGSIAELDKAYDAGDKDKVQTINKLIREGISLFTGEIVIE